MNVQFRNFNTAADQPAAAHFGFKDAEAHLAEMEASAQSGLPYYMSVDGKSKEMTDPAPRLTLLAVARARVAAFNAAPRFASVAGMSLDAMKAEYAKWDDITTVSTLSSAESQVVAEVLATVAPEWMTDYADRIQDEVIDLDALATQESAL